MADEREYGITTREQLDAQPCAACGKVHPPGEKEVVLHPRCHPDSPLEALYEDGCVKLSCAKCDHFVVAFRVV